MSLRFDLFQFLRGIAKQEKAGISWGFSDDKKPYPRIVLRLTGDSPEHHTRGACDFSTANVQITAYAKKEQTRSAHRVAESIARAIAVKLDGYHGPMEGTFCHSSELTERYQVEEQLAGKGGWLFGMVLEFTITHGVSVQATT